MEQSEYLVPNQDGLLSITITLSDITSLDVAVGVTITDGTAIGKYWYMIMYSRLICIKMSTVFYAAGMDYNVLATEFNVTIPAGELSSSFSIDIIYDVTCEDNITFDIVIRLLPSCLSLSLNISSSTVTIDNKGM